MDGVDDTVSAKSAAWMRRGPPARTTKAKARIGRYQQIVDAPRERERTRR